MTIQDFISWNWIRKGLNQDKKKLEDKIEKKKMNKKEEGDDLIFIWTVKYHKKVYFIFLKNIVVIKQIKSY